MKKLGIALTAVLIWALAGNVASAGLWDETANGGGDAGNLITTGQVTNGSGPLTMITGTIPNKMDADLFQIQIIDEASFTASTKTQYGGSTTFDSRLYLFDANGYGVTFNDDDPIYGGLGSTITSTFVTTNGFYWIGISCYPLSPNGSNGGFIWNANPYNTERAPDGPGAGYPLASWSGGNTATAGAYGIALTGATYAIPEPGTLALLVLGGCALLRRRQG